MRMQDVARRPTKPLRVLELYSGIGGMRYALAKAYPHLRCSFHAVDINLIANRVYKHNFGEPPRTISLEHLRASHFRHLVADLWTLSPPCQPFTTTVNSLQRDDQDPRSASFLHLLEILPQLVQPPSHLLLENVPAFLGSRCHQHWRAALDACNYQVLDVQLCPSQLGVPNFRPRAYSLATRFPYSLQPTFTQHLQQLAAVATTVWPVSAAGDSATSTPASYRQDRQAESAAVCRPLSAYLELDWEQQWQSSSSSSNSSSSSCDISGSSRGAAGSVATVQGWATSSKASSSSSATPFTPAASLPAQLTAAVPLHSGAQVYKADAEGPDGLTGSYLSCVPDLKQQLQRCAAPVHKVSQFHRVLDIVTPDSTHSNCFTKGYARHVNGAGSLLATRTAAAKFCQRDSRGRLWMVHNPYAAEYQGSSSQLQPEQPGQQQPLLDGAAASGGAGGESLGVLDARSTVAAAAVQQPCQPEAAAPAALQLRFFTPREVANLLGFPQPHSRPAHQHQHQHQQGNRAKSPRYAAVQQQADGQQQQLRAPLAAPAGFSFPADVQDRQAYALLGNSLSVDVVALLMQGLLEGWVQQQGPREEEQEAGESCS